MAFSGAWAATRRACSASTASLVGSNTQSRRRSTTIGSMTSRYCGGRYGPRKRLAISQILPAISLWRSVSKGIHLRPLWITRTERRKDRRPSRGGPLSGAQQIHKACGNWARSHSRSYAAMTTFVIAGAAALRPTSVVSGISGQETVAVAYHHPRSDRLSSWVPPRMSGAARCRCPPATSAADALPGKRSIRVQ